MIHIASTSFNNEFRTTQDLSSLNACIGETITARLVCYFESIIYASADNLILFEPNPWQSGLSNNTNVWWSEDGTSFAEFNVGDTFGIVNGAVTSTAIVLEKINDGCIRIGTPSVPYGAFGAINSWYAFNATPIKALRFNFNVTDQTDNYNSLIDGSLQEYFGAIDLATPGSYSINAINPKTWQYFSNAVVNTNVNTTDVSQWFEIQWSFTPSPLFLVDQYTDLVSGIKPDYFTNGLKLSYKINCFRSINDTNVFAELSNTDNSNIGWFNETFSNGATNYAIDSLQLQKGVTSVTALEFGSTIKVTTIIENTTDSPFTSATKALFGFNYLPDSSTFYLQNGKNIVDNFRFDKKLAKQTDGVVNGDYFGTANQIIKNIQVTALSTTQLQVEVNIEFGSTAEAVISQGDFKRYAMWCIVENGSLPALSSDKINLLLQVNEVYQQLTNTSLINPVLSGFLQHPFELDVDVNTGNIDVFPADDLVHNLDFSIDFTNYLTDGIVIKAVKPRVILRKTGQADILLEDFSFSTVNYPLVGGLVQNIAYNQDKPYKIPASIRKTIKLNRVTASDIGNTYFWKLTYPFFIRWEYWTDLFTSLIPSDLFNNTLPNNGFNHNWYRLNSIAGYEVYYEVEFEIEQNGQAFSQTIVSSKITINDFVSNTTDFASQKVESFDSSNNLLDFAGLKYLLGYEDVKVIASFEPNDISGYTVNDFDIVLEIETYENGGINDVRQISSVYQLDSNCWFKSTDTSNKVVKSMDVTYLKGEAYIDYTKIPNNINGFNIYARLYDYTTGSVVNGKQFMDSISFEFMDGSTYKFMDQ